jgi:hypothetical protein
VLSKVVLYEEPSECPFTVKILSGYIAFGLHLSKSSPKHIEGVKRAVGRNPKIPLIEVGLELNHSPPEGPHDI